MSLKRISGRFQRTQLKHVAVLLGLATAAFMVLRFAEQYFLARRFGPSTTLDAYFVAQVVFLFAAQCAVAVTSAGVPIIAARSRFDERAIQPADFTIVACLISVCVALSAVLFFAAPIMVKVFGPGLDQQSSSVARFLFRCSVPGALFSIVAAGLRAHWHSRKDLLWPGLLQLLTPLASTSLAVLVAVHLLPIQWVPLGASFGAFLFALALARPFLQCSREYAKLWSAQVAFEFGLALIPVCLAMVLIPCMIAVGRLFASRLDAGSVSALSIAASLMSIPGQLAATSVGIAILPRTSSFLSDQKHAAAASLIERALRVTVFTAVPFAALFALYPAHIVEMLFHGGSFDSRAINLTASALLGYCFGIPALGAMQVLTFALFASSAWFRVAGVTIFSFLVNAALSILLGHSVLGIATAFSITCCFSAVFLTLLLKQFVVLSPIHLLLSLGKAVAAAALAFGTVDLLCRRLLPQMPSLLQILLCFVLYAGAARMFCKPEMRELIGLFQLSRPSQPDSLQEETTLVAGAP